MAGDKLLLNWDTQREGQTTWREGIISMYRELKCLKTKTLFNKYQGIIFNQRFFQALPIHLFVWTMIPTLQLFSKKKKSTWYTRKSDCNSQRSTALSGKTLYRLRNYATCFTVRKTKWENFYAGIIRVKYSVCKDFHVTLDIFVSLYHTIIYTV